MWKDMLENALRDTANWQIKNGAIKQSSKSLLGLSSIQTGRTWISRRIITILLTNCLDMLVFSTNWGQTFCGLSTNLQEQSQNGLRHATNDWQDCFHTFITQMNSDNIAMRVTPLSIVDLVCSKTKILLATLRTRNQHRKESHLSSEAEHLSPSVGCARNKRQCLTMLQSLKSFLWMLGCEWMDYLLSIYGMWWSKYCIHRTVPNHQPIQKQETVGGITHPNLKRRKTEMLINCHMWTTSQKASLSCTSLKTVKQWSKWSWRAEVQRWDMFPEPTELRLIGYLTESTWNQRSNSNMLTPKTNSQTC